MLSMNPAPEFVRRKLVSLVQLGTALFLLPATGRAETVINELHFNPDVKTEAVEFIELHNTASEPAILTGWRLSDGVSFTFPDTVIPPGGFVVIAENPAALQAKFGVSALGPYDGKLSKYGDRVVLRDPGDAVRDEVEYGLGFPWPTVGDPPGYSIELIHPGLDNNLGGSWRASVTGGGVQPTSRTLLERRGSWRYAKGVGEPSSPSPAWRDPAFRDEAWDAGELPIGYDPALDLGTVLSDMRYNYSSVFLRRAFTVEDPGSVSALDLEALYDDGFKVWINGRSVLDVNISAGEVAFDGTAGPARESNDYETFAMPNAAAFLQSGANVIAIQLHNSSRDASSDCFFDCRLVARSGPTGRGPTPGRVNAAFAANAPPQARQIQHVPREPRSGEAVRITAKVTDPDGVGAVTLQYQLVDPGAYLELTDAEYESAWTPMPMLDNAQQGDEAAGDQVFTAVLPGDLQVHRRLIRYRVEVADTRGASVRLPYADDPQPNFAYFVYDGVPAWTGAVRPGSAGNLGQTFTVSAAEMNRLPVVHLLGKRAAIEESTWFSRYGGDAYPWLGTLVYDGRVYDHIRHRARGGVWRYSMVKNMWKFDLNRGHDFEARDNWGRKFDTPWTKLNLGASIQQGDYNHRGEQGMFESVGFRLFQLAGVPAPHTAFCQLRIIDTPEEVDASTQYEGDFWGVYLMIEQEDGRFLEEHGLADANFYKMEGGTGELNNLGAAGPVNKSDLNAFLNVVNGGAAASEAWFRASVNLPAYYSYQAIVQAIHHYDICYDKNFFYYFNPTNQVVTVTPWDLDLTWAENMYDPGCGGVDRLKSRMLPNASRYPALWREWQNRIREVRDLLWNEEEAWRLIDEYAGRLRGSTNAPGLLDADRAQWDYNPKMNNSAYTQSPGKAGQGRFYAWPNEPSVPRDFRGAVQLMKNYVSFRSTSPAAQARALDLLAADPAIPGTPEVTYAGPADYPVNALRFRCSAYSGSASFASMQWRIGAVDRPTAPSWQYAEPWAYEIEAVWESGLLAAFQEELAVPAGVLKPGRLYRARARFLDATGRAGHWSAPVEFVAGTPDNQVELKRSLRLTELMFHPPGGNTNEFIELHNADPAATLRLDGVAFTDGVNFVFPPGAALAPASYALVVRADPSRNFEAFRARHGIPESVPIHGPYTGSLADDGEQLTLKAATGGINLVSFRYRDDGTWPLAADGAGHSLVPRSDFGEDSTGRLDFGGNWRASAFIGGSPGAPDPEPTDCVVLNEIASHTDFTGEFDSNDWIELYNPAEVPVSLADAWFLSDSADDLRKWRIPPATTISARAFRSFDEITGFHHPTNTGFGIDKAGERLFLSHLPGNGADRVVDAVELAGQENGWAMARVPDGGVWDYINPRTRDGAAVPLAGRVVISEFVYHTGFATNLADPAQLEFVELHNAAAGPARLDDTHGVWRLGGGISFAFAAGTILPADGRLVVVPFPPTDATRVAAFRASYQIGSVVRLFGPFTGQLDNDTDRITLERPLAPDLPGETTGTVVADEVIYFDQPPWPGNADGNGNGYTRRFASRPGNDPANWMATTPSPGSAPSPSTQDSDEDGMPDFWEQAHGLDPAEAADAAADPDRDGLTNLEEFRAGQDPHEHSVRLVVAVRDGALEFTFLAPAGRSTGLEASPTADSGDWLPVSSTVLAAQASTAPRTVRVAPPPGASASFYRVGIW